MRELIWRRIGGFKRVWLVVALVVGVGGVPLFAEYVRGTSWLTGNAGATRLDFESQTKTSFVGPGAEIGTTTNADVIRVEAWIDGLTNFCAPSSPANQYGACTAAWYIPGPVWADGSGFSSSPIYGNFCAHGRHVFIRASTGQSTQAPDSYRCYTFQMSDQACVDLYGDGYWWTGSSCTYSPIVIAVGKRQDYRLTSAANGVVFDIDGDGSPEQIAWTAADSELAFLAIDRNGNGTIDDGRELFGSATVAGAANGFDALRDIEPITGPTGWIDYDDAVYPKLLLWEDRNHNGVSEAGELRKASEVLTRIGLGYGPLKRRDGNGNVLRLKGWATYRTGPGKNDVAGPHDGRQRDIYDVFFVVK